MLNYKYILYSTLSCILVFPSFDRLRAQVKLCNSTLRYKAMHMELNGKLRYRKYHFAYGIANIASTVIRKIQQFSDCACTLTKIIYLS